MDPSPLSNWVYDVFPSFSGEDVRQNFLSHFLKQFQQKLIIIFEDNKIKRGRYLGPELKQAIKHSRIAVVMFSEKYASSSWCLDELLEIVKCKEEFGQIVIPVFCGLDPTHVRKQTGVFGEMFEKTCENITEQVKNQWKKALTDVANITGYHIQNWDSEAKMIENIASDVLGKLNLTPSNDFEDLPGLEDHITEMNILLDLESEEVRMVGIWGPSGIGKTTIARALYSRLSNQFQNQIFIDRAFTSESMKGYNASNPDDYNTKLRIQSLFLAELLNLKDIKVSDLSAVRERLKHRKVLIIIDDLDNQIVLDTLAGQNQWFGKGSRIIVVTNGKRLLTAHGIDCIYEVGFPSVECALEMFCRYTFNQSSPLEGFEELAVEIVKFAGRLPLGLTILGKSLRGRSKESWMNMRLQNGLEVNIEKTLRVSYDVLDNKKDQAIFRHIACLFNLEKVKDIKLLLADSDLDIDIGLKNLVDKSLVHVHEIFDIVEMSPLLQKLGKEIVREQSFYNPGKREFLVDWEDICEVLEDNTGTTTTLGISLDIDEMSEISELHIHESAFKKMRNLRFLTINSSNQYMVEENVKVHLPDSFDHLPPKLKLLCWDGYPMKTLPSNFCPDHLVKIRMKNSKLKKLWEGRRPLKCLREMNFWGSENLKEIPDLSMATNLEKLYLGFRLSWLQTPSSIQSFNGSPKRLSPMEYSSLYLKNLVDFSMLNTKDEKLQPLFMERRLPDSLRMLFLSDSPDIVELPFSIKNLNKLTDLRITRCTNLETLPKRINLESLERLNVSGCSRLRTFPNISKNISSLSLEETAIEEVPWWIEIFSKLKYITMQRCSKLKNVNLNISKLKHLEAVNFSHCGALTGTDFNDYPSFMAIEAENMPTDASSSSSHPETYVPKVDFSFINCFNLDQEALCQQLSIQKLILSGEEVPLYFTHRTTGTSFSNIPVLHTPLSPPFFRFRTCAVVFFTSKPTYGAIGVYMKVKCRFKDGLGNQFDSQYQKEYFSVDQKGSHLLLLDCQFSLNKDYVPLAEVNYDQVDIHIHMSSGNSKFKFKEWGIRISEDCLPAENRLGDSNTLLQICEADEGNVVND